MVTSTNEGSFDPSGSQVGAAFIPLSTPTGRTAGLPFYRMVQNALTLMTCPHPSWNAMMEGEEEEYFPTAPLDDEVWSKDPIPERDLCIHVAPEKSAVS